MKITINENYFINTFKNENSDYENNFSYEGLKVLFNYLENLEEELNEEFTFDYIAIACDYTEWKTLRSFKSNILTLNQKMIFQNIHLIFIQSHFSVLIDL